MSEYTNNDMEVMDEALSWDDQIADDGQEFVILPEGDYDFTITKFERARHQGSEKLGPCPVAVVTLEIKNGSDTAYVTDRLFLTKKMEWTLSHFFVGIGQKKKGEPLVMNWNKVVGSTGRAQILQREFRSNNTGEMLKSNEVKKYYPKENTSAQKPYSNGSF